MTVFLPVETWETWSSLSEGSSFKEASEICIESRGVLALSPSPPWEGFLQSPSLCLQVALSFMMKYRLLPPGARGPRTLLPDKKVSRCRNGQVLQEECPSCNSWHRFRRDSLSLELVRSKWGFGPWNIFSSKMYFAKAETLQNFTSLIRCVLHGVNRNLHLPAIIILPGFRRIISFVISVKSERENVTNNCSNKPCNRIRTQLVSTSVLRNSTVWCSDSGCAQSKTLPHRQAGC